MVKLCMDEFYIDDLINEAIDQLSENHPDRGADSLEELAVLFKRAGISRKSFNDTRQHIIDQAMERTNPIFIKIKLETFERKLQENRNGTRKRIIVPTRH